MISDTVFWRAYRHDGAGALCSGVADRGSGSSTPAVCTARRNGAEGTVRQVDLKGRGPAPSLCGRPQPPDRLCQYLPPGRPGECAELGGAGAAAVRLRGKEEPGPGRMGPGERATTTMSWRRGGIPPASCWTRPVRAIR